MEDTAVKTEKKVASLTKSVTELAERLQDQENRGRRKNLRILGLGVEGSDAVKFMEQWIPRILDIEAKAGWIKLERAHHIPRPTAYQGPPHRSCPVHDRQVPQLFRPPESYEGCTT